MRAGLGSGFLRLRLLVVTVTFITVFGLRLGVVVRRRVVLLIDLTRHHEIVGTNILINVDLERMLVEGHDELGIGIDAASHGRFPPPENITEGHDAHALRIA